jgi:hypothetical protein
VRLGADYLFQALCRAISLVSLLLSRKTPLSPHPFITGELGIFCPFMTPSHKPHLALSKSKRLVKVTSATAGDAEKGTGMASGVLCLVRALILHELDRITAWGEECLSAVPELTRSVIASVCAVVNTYNVVSMLCIICTTSKWLNVSLFFLYSSQEYCEWRVQDPFKGRESLQAGRKVRCAVAYCV